MKKYSLMIFVFLLAVSSNAFAVGQNTFIVSQMTSLVSTVAGIVMALSVLIIVYSGFVYVTSQGDDRAVEKAKSQIVYSGVGMFISLTSVLIIKIISNLSNTPVQQVQETQTSSPPSPLAIGIIIAVTILVVIGVVVSLIVKSVSTDKQPVSVKEIPTVDIKQVEKVLNDLSNYEPNFSNESSLKLSFDEWRVQYSFEQQLSVLSLHMKDTLMIRSSYSVLDSSYTIDKSMVELNTSHQSKLKSIHEQFIYAYLKEHSSLEKLVSYLLSKMPDSKAKDSVTNLLSLYQEILPFGSQLDEEKRFFLEETFLRDTELLIDSFIRLSPEQQVSHESSILDKISILNEHLKETQNELDHQVEMDLLYVFRIIEKRYQKD